MTSGRGVVRARPLHPGAWWAWAAAVAAAASQTTNPVVLGLLGAVVCFVVVARRNPAAPARTLGVFIRFGLVVVAIRVGLNVLVGDRIAGHVLFTLPSVPLPHWAEGVSIGGPVTAESLLASLCGGLQIAVVLLAFGAANALSSPYRLLRCLPSILYEAGVAVTVALAYAPELVRTIGEVRAARRLRGRPTRGVAGLRGMAVPVLEGALDRSLELAASMDARGYGRFRSPTMARRGRAATAVGALCLLAGLFDVLSATTSLLWAVVAIASGAGLVTVGAHATTARLQRTRYRPDPWCAAEWSVVALATASLGLVTAAHISHEAGLAPTFSALALPSFPLWAVAGAIVAFGVVAVTPHVPAPQSEPAAVELVRGSA